jgi:hypothetical protein
MGSEKARATASVRADRGRQKEKSKRFIKRLPLTIVEALNMALRMSLCRLVDMVVNPRSGEESSPPSSPPSPSPQHERGAACRLLTPSPAAVIARITGPSSLTVQTRPRRKSETTFQSRGNEHHDIGLDLNEKTWPCSPKNAQHMRCIFGVGVMPALPHNCR